MEHPHRLPEPAHSDEHGDLTHLEEEEERQRVQQALAGVETDQLRRARAWFLDLIKQPEFRYPRLVELRGQIVHAEIERRETLARGGLGNRARLWWNAPTHTDEKCWRAIVAMPHER